MKNYKKGLTLIETMIGLTISGMASLTFIGYVENRTKTDTNFLIVNDIEEVIDAFDQRIDIDGYNINLWQKTEWKDTKEVVDDLLQKEFHSKDAKNCSGEWEPQTDDENLNLIDCNLWQNKIPLNLEFSAELKKDENDFITQANLYIKPPIDGNVEKDYSTFKDILVYLKAKNNNSKNGYIFYDFYSEPKNEYFSKIECLNNFNDCVIKATYNRLGDSDSLHTDGSNALVNTHINFVEDISSAPLQCVRWIKDSDDNWTLADDNKECGIGMYNDTSHPVLVEVAAQNSTFENIVLNEQCTQYTWNNTTKDLNGNGVLTPCGMSHDGSETYQVIQNTHSTNIFSEYNFIEEIDGDTLTVDDLYANDISTDFLTIKNDLEVQAKSKIYDLTSNGISHFKGDITIENALTILTNIQFHSEVDVKQTMLVEGDFNTDDINTKRTDIEFLDSNTSLNATNMRTKYLNIKGKYSENQSCANKGSIAKDNNNELLNCVNGKWKSIKNTELIGTVMSWGHATPPDGWIECNGQSTSSYPELRSIVGNNVPDLRGYFVRGYQSNNSKIHNNFGIVLDPNRGFKSYQSDKFKAHNHTEKHFSGDREDKGGSSGADESLQSVNTSTVGGAESRPENIALMYIIKAE